MKSVWLASTGKLPPGPAAAIAALSGVLLAPMLAFRFQRDQAHFAYVADLWNQGLLPYVQSSSHQWPGQHALYRLIFSLLGTTEVAVRAFDVVLHIVACVALAALTARFARPLTGLLAAALYAVFYVQLGPWDTANRETYQIALLLPVAFWLIRDPLPRRWDRVVSFAAGATVAFAALIKPTIGLAVVVLIWCVLSPLQAASRELRGRRMILGTAGALCVVGFFLVTFRSHASAVYFSLISYNVSVYSQIPPEVPSRWAVLGLDLERGSFLAPIAWFLIPRSLLPLALRLLALQLATLCAVIVQGKGFDYHLALTMPLTILWGAVFLDVVANGINRRFRFGRPIEKTAGVACILLIAIWLPQLNVRYLRDYANILVNPAAPMGRLAPVWDAAVNWIGRYVEQDEMVCVIGLDSGVQFLARLKPCSMHSETALDLRSVELMKHSLIREGRRALLRDLRAAQPTWILVEKYEETWFSRSAADSLATFPELREFLFGHYVLNRVMKRNPTMIQPYLIFKRS